MMLLGLKKALPKAIFCGNSKEWNILIDSLAFIGMSLILN